MSPRPISTSLKHEFLVFFPTKCMCGKPLPAGARARVFQDAKEKMSEWFGGATTTRGTGAWYDDGGVLHEEEVDLLISYANAKQAGVFFERFQDLLVEIGRSLYQREAAGRVDSKFLSFPTSPERCIHEGATATPVAERPEPSEPTDRDRKLSIWSALHRLASLNDARSLFVHVLHYEYDNTTLPTYGWPDDVKKTLAPGFSPQVIAEQNEFKIIYLKLRDERLLKTEERKLIARILHDLPDMRGLVVVSDSEEKNWNLVNVKFTTDENRKAKFLLRRMRVGPNEWMRTAVERLSLIDIDVIGEDSDAATIQELHDKAFDVQAVTKEFFSTYEKVFSKVENLIEGFGAARTDEENRRLFTQQLFNRLLFVAFIQRKGWLSIDGSTDYLNSLWRNYRKSREDDGNFYRDRLRPLFFIGLNNPGSINITGINDGGVLFDLIGSVPFLNGGLFEERDLDDLASIVVPDSAVELILDNLFGRFNFTVSESTPLDQEVAVDPEMLGTIFERLVTGRHESGSYYTPKPIVSFMCRESLKQYLLSACSAETEQGIGAFVDDHDSSALRMPERVFGALQVVTVCDPACGSGAYLLGMLHELMDLRDCLFVAHKVGSREAYERKLEIIQSNLYGVDIDPFAVNIARLRLWLSLAVDFEGEEGATPPALPNLDFKIEIGDSLGAADPRPTDNLFRDVIVRQADKLVALKSEYLISSGPRKSELSQRIGDEEQELQSILADDPTPEGAFDWRVGFAEVFSKGGFEIVVGNPPYVRIQELRKTNPALVDSLRGRYESAGRGNYDLYVVFVERGLQLLTANGQLAYILPHKFFTAKYGEPLRGLISRDHLLRKVVHFGDQQVFDGVTNYVCLLFLTTHENPSCLWIRVDSLANWLESGLAENGLVESDSVTDSEWNFVVGKSSELFSSLDHFSHRLRDFTANVFQGLVTSADKVYLLEPRSEERDGLVSVFSRATGKEYSLETAVVKPLCKGSRDIHRYMISPSKMVLFPYDPKASEASGRSELIPPEVFSAKYPCAWDYLCENKDSLENRENGKMKHERWYGFVYPKSVARFEKPKLLTPSIASRASFAFDEDGSHYFVGSGGGGGGGYGILLRPDCDLDPHYVLGLMNSRLLDFYLQRISSPFQGGFFAYSRQYIDRVPIRSLDLEVASERSMHDQIVGTVKRILDAKASPDTDTTGIERELDHQVYRLFGLKNREIGVVESLH
jgi:hypothetical protein